jgi:hypothetical protein
MRKLPHEITTLPIWGRDTVKSWGFESASGTSARMLRCSCAWSFHGRSSFAGEACADEGQQVVRVEPAPSVLRSLQQLDRHRQSDRSRAGPRRNPCPTLHRGTRRLNGGATLFPGCSRELDGGSSRTTSVTRAAPPGIGCLIILDESLDHLLAGGLGVGSHHLVQGPLRLGLERLSRMLAMRGPHHRASRISGQTSDTAPTPLEPHRPWPRLVSASWGLEIPQHGHPVLCALMIPLLTGDHLLGLIRGCPDHAERC